MTPLTLLRQDSPLAKAENQRRHLEDDSQVSIPAFQSVLKDNNLHPLFTSTLQVLQINVGKLCNQTCQHCHVDAGPDRRELMSKETFEHCLRLLAESDIETVDITGGAPEMNPHFEWFVSEVRKLNRQLNRLVSSPLEVSRRLQEQECTACTGLLNDPPGRRGHSLSSHLHR